MAGTGRVSYGAKSGATLYANVRPPDSVARIVEKMRRDPYVKLAERVLMSNVKSAQVTVTSKSSDPRTQVLASTLQSTWFRHLRYFQDVFAYGRVAFEVAWAALPAIGLDVVSQIIPLPYEMTSLKLDNEGQFSGIQFGEDDSEGEGKEKSEGTLTPLYSWWLAIDPGPLEPHGTSRFLGAMQAVWKEREDAITRRRTFLRKYALGDLIFQGPQWDTRDGQNVDVWAEFAASAYDSEAGDILCYDPGEVATGDNGTRPKYSITKDPAPAKDGSPLILVTDKLGEEILLAAGIPPKTVVEGDAVGSFALVTQQMLVLFSTVEDLLSQVGESYQKNIIDKAVELNAADPIQWNYAPLTARKDDLATEIVRAWLTTPQLSPLVTSGGVDVLGMLDMVGIPVSSDATDKLRRMLASAQAVAQQSADPMAAQLSSRLWG